MATDHYRLIVPRPLDVINIVDPCLVDWAAMAGDDRRRYCDHCSLHVHDLSAMTAAEAESLVQNAHGRVCVSFERRTDGSIATRRPWMRWITAIAALVTAIVGLPGCARERLTGAVVTTKPTINRTTGMIPEVRSLDTAPVDGPAIPPRP